MPIGLLAATDPGRSAVSGRRLAGAGHAAAQRGFTLIEVTVATLVLAIGILGVAAMQLTGTRSNQAALARTQAIYLAQDMLERIRANPRGPGLYDGVDTQAGSSVPADPGCADRRRGCTASQMAGQDVREWAAYFVNVDARADYRPRLPNGRGQVSRSGREFTVTLRWDERAGNSEQPLTRALTLVTTLP